jgi:tRNA G18 (ribose-2'-O)-methylase SpoU
MAIARINDLNDPRLADYRELKERELARRTDRFIAESEHVVRRLLTSDFPVESVLLAERRVDEMAPLVPENVSVLVVPNDLIHQVVGYKFHSGVLACGQRKPSPTLEDVLPKNGRVTLVILPEIANTENLGSMIRIAAAFGVDAMILGERSCDPFFRQSIRVSMGTVFRLPIIQSQDLMHDLARLRDAWKVELIATVLDDDAEPLSNVRRQERVALLFGNEAQGLSQQVIRACDRRVTITMKSGTDSLNVAVSAGIFLHHFT